uniref:Uncharacterized protein n=1 Tax=Romanomermis culicivorax TaxID=13658 RepID=A0A915HEM7_ROMCU
MTTFFMTTRFLDILPVEYAAQCIVDDILWEKEEAFVPSYIPLLLLLLKSPKRVKAVWDQFFQFAYHKHGYQAID